MLVKGGGVLGVSPSSAGVGRGFTISGETRVYPLANSGLAPVFMSSYAGVTGWYSSLMLSYGLMLGWKGSGEEGVTLEPYVGYGTGFWYSLEGWERLNARMFTLGLRIIIEK